MVYRLMVDNRLNLPATMEFRNPERDEDGVLILDLRTARISERAKAFAKRRGGAV